ncbi:MAG: helix-turn-helix transcriptional regulator [Oscillospiraceae bacterium]|nr:helix-turn-helix transcriptional regulator [Oscillospiraceae bacterium]
MNKLREYRQKKNLTQEELSKISGVSRPTISMLETGDVSVSKTDTLTKLADALNETVSSIFFSE